MHILTTVLINAYMGYLVIVVHVSWALHSKSGVLLPIAIACVVQTKQSSSVLKPDQVNLLI